MKDLKKKEREQNRKNKHPRSRGKITGVIMRGHNKDKEKEIDHGWGKHSYGSLGA